MSARASPRSTPRTLWITERSATIAPTPIAMQTKKNSSRRHDARSLAQRHAQDERSCARPPAATAARARIDAGRRAAPDCASASAASSGVVRHQHQRRACARGCTSSSRSMMWRPLALSRLPVGSSASRIGGSLASARAMRDALLLAAGQLRRVVVRRDRSARLRRAARRARAAASRRAGDLHRHQRRSRARSATASGGRTGRRSRSSRRAASPARLRRAR